MVNSFKQNLREKTIRFWIFSHTRYRIGYGKLFRLSVCMDGMMKYDVTANGPECHRVTAERYCTASTSVSLAVPALIHSFINNLINSPDNYTI